MRRQSIITELIEIQITRQISDDLPRSSAQFRALVNGDSEKLAKLRASILQAISDAGASIEDETR